MCNNFPNIRITEGNNFSLVLPLRSRTYVATRPIDEDIDPAQLENVIVTFGGVEYPAQITAQGVQIDLPATLAVGTYNILLTAEYLESSIRAAYESAVTIVPWSAQSTAEQYITGSPIVMRAAYVLSGAMTDAELEALKQEYREKNAELDQAIADAEAAKREWEEKAADLDGVAQEATSQEILTAVENIDFSELAKEATAEAAKQAALDAKAAAQANQSSIGTPVQGQPSNLFEAIAASGASVQDIVNGILAQTNIEVSFDGTTFVGGVYAGDIGSAISNMVFIESYKDAYSTYFAGGVTIGNNLKNVTMSNLQSANSNSIKNMGGNITYLSFDLMVSIQSFLVYQMSKLEVLNIPRMEGISGSYGYIFSGCPNLIQINTGSYLMSNAYFGDWNPTTALSADSTSLVKAGETFTSNLEKLLYNIREHIAANLQTITQGYAITFSAAVKAAILADQPTADAFTNKGWIIA